VHNLTPPLICYLIVKYTSDKRQLIDHEYLYNILIIKVYFAFLICIIGNRSVLIQNCEMTSGNNNNRSLLPMVKRKRIHNANEEAANQFIGKQLFIMRRKLGISQEAMAEVFDVSLSSYKRWEIEGPKSYPLSFWNVYSELSSKTTDNTMREYHTGALSFFTSLFKKSQGSTQS